MPYYDGFYGLRKILEFDHNAKIVIVSASINQDEKEQLAKLGAFAIVRKPYEMDSLVGLLFRASRDDNLGKKPIII
jgi:DNA-binding response OmpR family regulator